MLSSQGRAPGTPTPPDTRPEPSTSFEPGAFQTGGRLMPTVLMSIVNDPTNFDVDKDSGEY